jgi:hypothetical protein
MLDPLAERLTPDFAKAILELRADPQLQAHVDDLADRNTEGKLTPDERREYEAYVVAGQLIAFLQAKARKLLQVPRHR